MAIDLIPSIITLIFGLGLGALIGWMVTRTVHAEKLKAFQHAESRFREAFQALAADERRIRPDVVVRLPGGKFVVIDAKAPLDAYLKALEAPDEAARQVLLADHARQVRVHLGQLAAKGYAEHVQPSPDFVVMFL